MARATYPQSAGPLCVTQSAAVASPDVPAVVVAAGRPTRGLAHPVSRTRSATRRGTDRAS